ncbi:MAG: hypothetical protein AM326_03015 [Candidatus Thorarchaeota archaeon SMTZ-45]|nr:MAG: hypothetical protein AM326_03015 [Candidatus Thorarchaeota archaeon SMTZ-45]
MSAPEDWWESVYDQIITQLIAMTELDSESVFYGERFTPEKTPSVFVVPTEIIGGPGTVQKEDYDAKFDVVIFVNDPNTKDGIIESLKLGVKIKNMFIADRTLNGLLENLDATVHRHWRGVEGYEDHWVHVILSCRSCM